MKHLMYQVASYGYFEWHDKEIGDRARIVINELKIEKKMLIESNKHLSARLERPLMSASSEVEVEISHLWDELCKLKHDKQQDKNELEVKNKKLIVAYTVAIISWMLVLYLVVFVQVRSYAKL